MPDSTINDLLAQFSKAAVSSEAPGVSFRGQCLKLDCQNDCKDVIAAINNCPDMTYLDLEGNTLGVDAAMAIGEALKERKKLTRALWKDLFTGRMKTEIPKALKYLGAGLTSAGAKLTELDLSDNALGPIGVEALAEFLQSPVCYQLQELRLNNNGLGITGAKLLAKALLAGHKNSLNEGQPLALKVFIAGRNRLENDGATALSSVFQVLGSLEEISMPQNGIGHKGISMISDALTHNKNLRLLNLNDNTLNDKGVKSLTAALPALQKLQILDLGDCLLKTKGAITLAAALSEQHGELKEVILDSNEIETDGGLAIIKALKNKRNLERLSLQENEFHSQGRLALRSEAKKLQRADALYCPSDSEGSDEEEDEGSDEESEGSEEEETDEEDGHESSVLRSPSSSIPANPSAPSEKQAAYLESPIGKFLINPTPENLFKMTEQDVGDIFESLKVDGSQDVVSVVKLIMKVSNLGSCKNEAVKKGSRDVAIGLYKELFDWADQEGALSQVHDVLFVHLQLIKDEDNEMKQKIDWDVDRCVNVLQAAIVEKIVPSFTQHILTCCLERKFQKKITTGEITIA